MASFQEDNSKRHLRLVTDVVGLVIYKTYSNIYILVCVSWPPVSSGPCPADAVPVGVGRGHLQESHRGGTPPRHGCRWVGYIQDIFEHLYTCTLSPQCRICISRLLVDFLIYLDVNLEYANQKLDGLQQRRRHKADRIYLNM